MTHCLTEANLLILKAKRVMQALRMSASLASPPPVVVLLDKATREAYNAPGLEGGHYAGTKTHRTLLLDYDYLGSV
jgi:hypothetical protein